MMKRIPGGSLEDYVNNLFSQWQPGDKEREDGVLLAIFIKDRKLRIETGYGLEGVLPDAVCKLIIETRITPLFKQGNFHGGITAGGGRHNSNPSTCLCAAFSSQPLQNRAKI